MILFEGMFALLVAATIPAFQSGIEATDPLFTSGSDEVIVVREGETALLLCSVENLDGQQVVWVKQGGEDPSDTEVLSLGSVSLTGNPRISIVSEWNLQIHFMDESDEGIYICQVTQTDPTMKQFTSLKLAIPAKVDVIEPFAEEYLDSTDPRKRIFREGLETAPLDCISSGYPLPEIRWTRVSWRDINQAFPVARTEIVNTMLLIKNLRRMDAGLYKCRARNDGGHDEETIELVVEYKPEASLTETDIRKKEGDTVTLQCFVESIPPPEVTWKKGNETLTIKQSSEAFHVAKYKISSLVPEDYGLYSCFATNKYGTSESFITISGLPTAPFIISPKMSNRRNQYLLKYVEAEEGGATISSYTLLYRSKENLQLNSTFPVYDNWTREVINASYQSFTLRSHLLTDLEPSTQYELQMWAQNKYGNGDIFTFDFETSDVDLIIPTTTSKALSNEQSVTMENTIKVGSSSNGSPKTTANSASLNFILLFLGYLSL